MNANGFEKLHGIDEMDEKQVLTLCRTAEQLTRQKLSGTIELYRPVKVQTGRTPRQTGARRIRRTNVMKRIGILGAGTWGMALARMLTVSGNDVLVWSAIEKEIDSLSTTRKHPNLPQMKIPDELRFTKSIEEVCKDKDILLFAVPSVFVRSTAAKARPYVADGQIIVDVAKGIEPDTLYTMTEILADELGKEGGPKGVRLVALSGPTHAEEVAIDLPTTIVSASKDMEAAAYVQEVFTNNVMRVYTNEDIKGVELSGAMKNVIALGVGISTGLGYGDNARAALITRGIAEIARLGVAMGCNVHTFAGLAGIGDLIVTATSMHSRNNRAGILIGKGETPENAVKEVGMVVEGMNALPAALELAERYQVEMPIVQTVNAIVNKGMSAAEAVKSLMERGLKNELPQHGVRPPVHSTLDSLTDFIQENINHPALKSLDSFNAANLLQSLLNAPGVFTPLAHYILPLDVDGTKAFGELWVDNDENNPNNTPGTQRNYHLFLTFDVESIGRFEVDLYALGDEVKQTLLYPPRFEKQIDPMKDRINKVVRNVGYNTRAFETAPLKAPHNLTEIFPKIVDKRTTLNTRV